MDVGRGKITVPSRFFNLSHVAVDSFLTQYRLPWQLLANAVLYADALFSVLNREIKNRLWCCERSYITYHIRRAKEAKRAHALADSHPVFFKPNPMQPLAQGFARDL